MFGRCAISHKRIQISPKKIYWIDWFLFGARSYLNNRNNSLEDHLQILRKRHDKETCSVFKFHSLGVFSQSGGRKEKDSRPRFGRSPRQHVAMERYEENFGKSCETRRQLESRTVGKSHEWPRNVNEAPVTQFCLAPLHPPAFLPLALGRRKRERRKGERDRMREKEGRGKERVPRQLHRVGVTSETGYRLHQRPHRE